MDDRGAPRVLLRCPGARRSTAAHCRRYFVVLLFRLRAEPLVALGRRVLSDGWWGLPVLLGASPSIGLLADVSALVSCRLSPGVRKRAMEPPKVAASPAAQTGSMLTESHGCLCRSVPASRSCGRVAGSEPRPAWRVEAL